MQINPKKILEEKILIPCEYTECQQVGIDLTISKSVVINHGHAVNVLLNEQVFLPDNIFATFTHRSSYNRIGVLITGSIYDPGYRGVVGCTIYNLSGSDRVILVNTRIGQMVFYQADSATKYDGQYQNEFLEENNMKKHKSVKTILKESVSEIDGPFTFSELVSVVESKYKKANGHLCSQRNIIRHINGSAVPSSDTTYYPKMFVVYKPVERDVDTYLYYKLPIESWKWSNEN